MSPGARGFARVRQELKDTRAMEGGPLQSGADGLFPFNHNIWHVLIRAAPAHRQPETECLLAAMLDERAERGDFHDTGELLALLGGRQMHQLGANATNAADMAEELMSDLLSDGGDNTSARTMPSFATTWTKQQRGSTCWSAPTCTNSRHNQRTSSTLSGGSRKGGSAQTQCITRIPCQATTTGPAALPAGGLYKSGHRALGPTSSGMDDGARGRRRGSSARDSSPTTRTWQAPHVSGPRYRSHRGAADI